MHLEHLKAVGGGSNSLEWTEAFDVLPTDESDPEPIAIRKFEADKDLLLAAQRAKTNYSKGRVVEGTIGSADVWNNELDRIAFFHKNYGTSVEEMEAVHLWHKLPANIKYHSLVFVFYRTILPMAVHMIQVLEKHASIMF